MLVKYLDLLRGEKQAILRIIITAYKTITDFMCLTVASNFPKRIVLSWLVKRLDIQMSVDEIYSIVQVIVRTRPCSILVFGFGNDSLFWHKINKNGRTIFLEDSKYWFDRADKRLTGYLVRYGTRLPDWRHILELDEREWMMGIPELINDKQWDIVLVDGPGGCSNETPGRMQSIQAASMIARMSKDNIWVFVHDCDRKVEAVYCDKFLSWMYSGKFVDRLRCYSNVVEDDL